MIYKCETTTGLNANLLHVNYFVCVAYNNNIDLEIFPRLKHIKKPSKVIFLLS